MSSRSISPRLGRAATAGDEQLEGRGEAAEAPPPEESLWLSQYYSPEDSFLVCR